MNRKLLIFLLALLTFSNYIFAQDQFTRTDINPPDTYASGFGATVSGVDLDGDGKLEIYSVAGMSDFFTGDEIPQIIKYEQNGTSWDSVWAASFPNERQNTWAALTTGDLDGDGKLEIIWGFVNSFSTNTNPPRIVVFEADGDDVLGISDGNGNYTPNAQWNMDLPESTNMRPLKWIAVDIDEDGTQEVVFADRRSDYLNWGVVSTTDIPDAGDGSETWSLEISGQSEFYNRFSRMNVLEGPDGSFGGSITGMDYDNDGLMDLYAVNDNWTDSQNGELIPTLFKYELEAGSWVLRWSTPIPGIDFQNTWPVLVAADWDEDGLGEVIWCPVNNLAEGNEDPSRIVVYEAREDNSEGLGIDNGDGTFSPNAQWNMDVPASTEMRPFSGTMADVDGDSELEFVFAERRNHYVWGVIGVDDIPNTGDGSETWTMEANGQPDAGNDYRDIAVIDQTVYLFGSGGDVRVITNDGTNYTVSEPHQAYPGWSWLSANTVDLDDDGNMEIVTGDYLSSGSGSVWVLTPDADTLVGHKVADFSDNSASRITNVRVGDLNADGLADFVVGFRGTDAIYRVAYNGGDITSEASYTISLLDEGVLGAEEIGQMDAITVEDVNGDGSDEVFYSGVPRSVPENTQPLTVGSYYDTLKTDAGARWDIAVANGSIHLFNGSGDLQRVDYSNDQWNIYPTQPGIVNGSFLSATNLDVDEDGIEEIITGNWYDAKVKLLKWMNGAWTAAEIADFTDMGGNRLNGGDVGDIDNDGYIDFVTGSRASNPNGQVYRVEYMGGDIMDAASWEGTVIHSEVNEKFTQYEVINIANLDDDSDMEVLYTSDYARGPNSADDDPFPIIILDLYRAVQKLTIAEARVDANNDFIPDMLDSSVTVIGVVTSPNYTASSGNLGVFIQDETGGIYMFANDDDSTSLDIGTKVQVTGVIGQYNGATEIDVENTPENLVALGVDNLPEPIELTIPEYLENAEMYEALRLEFKGIAKASGDWPEAGNNAWEMDFTDGVNSLLFSIDKDTDVDDGAEPTYPINVIAIGNQFDNSEPYDGGYQVYAVAYDDITQNVSASPNPYFFFTDDTKMIDGTDLEINNPEDQFELYWHPAVDLNDDDLIYQLVAHSGVQTKNYITGNNGMDTSIVLTGQDLIDYMMANAEVETKLFVQTVSMNGGVPTGEPVVNSVDTITVNLKDNYTDVEDLNMIPEEFYVKQNYPNPFNPSTTISFGLPQASNVDLRVYNILGQEVAVLINNQEMSAGRYHELFNASRLASGAYIYVLKTKKDVVTKKMLLVK